MNTTEFLELFSQTGPFSDVHLDADMENRVFITDNTSNASKRHKSQRISFKVRTNARSKIRKKSDFVSTKKRKQRTREKSGAESKAPQVEVGTQAQVPDSAKTKQDVSRDGIEKVLEQLVSSLSRVEDRVSSVEEHVKNPTSSIEARLKEIEQQLKKLEKISQENASTPGISCHKSYDNDHFSCNEKSNVVESDGLEGGENADCTKPGFIVTAPEFSDTEDASPGSNSVVDKCETVNDFPENQIDGGFGTTAPQEGPGKRHSAKISRIFTCFSCSGL